MDDRTLAISLGIVAVAVFVLQLTGWAKRAQLPTPRRLARVFVPGERRFALLAAHGVQAVDTVVLVALGATSVGAYDGVAPPVVKFAAVVPAVLSLLLLVSYYLAYNSQKLRGLLFLVCLVVVNALATFAAFVALPAMLGVPKCQDIVSACPPARVELVFPS